MLVLTASAAWLCAAGAGFAAPRVASIDQCADQYVLALSRRENIVGLSYRADDADSYMRRQAAGLPQLRVTAESLLIARPAVVVRYWGGDTRLETTLRRRGVTVVRIEDAEDFDGVRANVRRVAAALGEPARGEALISRMDRQLAVSQGAWRGRPGLYLTPSGYTAGKGTFIDRILAAAGLRNAAPQAGFAPVRLEEVVLGPPRGFVLGFFDRLSAAFERWGMGRHRALQKRLPEQTLAALPASVLSCPGWFAADGVETLARAAPGFDDR
ncbi:MAG: ABC transporter substrate-binding protein [Caulobacter sp.]|nr:ABC transporter substrate-binding protein [Caulobacter sp.]